MHAAATARLRNAIGPGLFLALTAGCMVLFLQAFAPAWRPADPPPFDGYDRAAMQAALAPERVQIHLDAIRGFGSRLAGQPGFEHTAQYIHDRLQDAGVALMEMEVEAVVPVTVRRELRDASGAVLAGMTLYPFMPNHFQPMVTGAEGLSGEVVLMTDDTLNQRADFEGCIGLIDVSRPPQTYAMQWDRYAQLGVAALILAHPEGLEAVSPAVWKALPGQMVSGLPVNFVRLMASADIFRQVGATVTLHVRQEFQTVPTRVILGALRGATRAEEALVISAEYDAGSLLPDLSPGVLQAHGVAQALACAEGLAGHRDTLRRDVWFMFSGTRVMAGHAAASVIGAIGPNLARAPVGQRILAEHTRNAADAAIIDRLHALVTDPAFLASPDTGAPARLAALDAPARTVFDTQYRYVLNTRVFEEGERLLQARLALMRAGVTATDDPLHARYQATKRAYDTIASAAGFNLPRLIAHKWPLIEDQRLAERLAGHFERLRVHHATQARRLDQQRRVHEAFANYRNIYGLLPELYPAMTTIPVTTPPELGFTSAHAWPHGQDQDAMFNRVFLNAIQNAARHGAELNYFPYQSGLSGAIAARTASLPLSSSLWNAFSYPAFALVHTDRTSAYELWSCPLDLPFMRTTAGLRPALLTLGEVTLSLAYGNGRFREPNVVFPRTYTGKVFVGGVGDSIVPNYPLAGALVGCKPGGAATFQAPGYFDAVFTTTDVYGEYRLSGYPGRFNSGFEGYAPNAAAYDTEGRIAYIKDDGAQAQSVYKSRHVNLWLGDLGPIHMVVFRAAPVALLDLVNPQTLKPYTGAELIDAAGLSGFEKQNRFATANAIVQFVPPDERFLILLKAGSIGNELVQTIRAVALGVGAAWRRPPPEGDHAGDGYLAADTPQLLHVPRETARSMAQLNASRLELLRRHRMAEARTTAFQENAERLLAASEDAALAHHDRVLLERDSATYSILNYPVIRATIFDAVYGILWYLGLLVPFVVFFEKLIFGHPDIRKQIAATSTIFIVAFLLLKLLHPAFAMIRSSLMILLGFVILLISIGVIGLLSGRFQENLEAIRRQRGRVSAAEVNRMGVLGTAFALGLNNMHRRKVRTGLTCATLVLITFAMLCFTTVQNTTVDSETAVGRAGYQGILVKPDRFRPISESERFALEVKYGRRYAIAPRAMFLGVQTWTREVFNPELTISLAGEDGGSGRRLDFASMLFLAPEEPLAPQIRLLTQRGWFAGADGLPSGGAEPAPILIPDGMARRLGLTPAMVDRAEPRVIINGETMRVKGIFEAASLENARDLDGHNLLPFDVTAMLMIQTEGGEGGPVLARAEDVRLQADRVVLCVHRKHAPVALHVPRADLRTVSLAVRMDGLGYREARHEIGSYLEQTGKAAYYGLDGYAYLGKRLQEASLAGFLDLLIPLFIAAVTVLNTMKGSVYERRDEIFVYNAIGIAPRHIFFMFIAEALVYAVVGTVLGYLLAQGLGSLLSVLGWTGGLQLTFASRSTVYVSLAIIAATLFSTWFPARSALEIAAPAEDSGWTLPPPEGDTLSFTLPFTFNHHDRIAILAFFNRYFHDMGEGSAGRFFAGPPRLGVSERFDALKDNALIPQIAATIWLKPYDLGVSQRLVIDLETDPETTEYIARITLTRLSGTRDAWQRLNHGFVGQIRGHFLHWRAVNLDERTEMFIEASDLLAENLKDDQTIAPPRRPRRPAPPDAI